MKHRVHDETSKNFRKILPVIASNGKVSFPLMPGKLNEKPTAGRDAGIAMVIFLVVLLTIFGIAFTVETALRAVARASSFMQASEAMAQESRSARKPTQPEPQVWVGELHAVGGGGHVQYLQAKGSFRTRSECDAWVQRYPRSAKIHFPSRTPAG